jgi:ATP-binding cassette subfamily C protein
MTKTIRLFLQSAMLGMGAYLVLQNELTPGAMIAGSILLGRALAPVEMGLNQWPIVQRGMTGWENLAQLLGVVAVEAQRTQLPKPRAMLVTKTSLWSHPVKSWPRSSRSRSRLSRGRPSG